MMRPKLIREVGFLFIYLFIFFAFILVTFLFILCQLFSFSFSLSSPLASSYLQVKKCWRESLVYPLLQVGASPSRHQNLPHGCSRHPTVLAVPCMLPLSILSLWGCTNNLRRPSCHSNDYQSWSQEGENCLLLFQPPCPGEGCARKWQGIYCNSGLS